MASPAEQSRKTFVSGAVLVAAGCAILFSVVAHTRPFTFLENGTYDARMRWSAKPSAADKNIVVIDIDDASFNGLKDKLGRWPWSRQVWTELLRYTGKGQPKAVAFDSMFGGSETDPVDAEFAQLIQRSGNVVLAYSLPPGEATSDPEEEAQKLQLLSKEAAPADSHTVGEHVEVARAALNVPLPQLATTAAGLGDADATFDEDGVGRRIPLAFIVQGNAYRGLSRRIADEAMRRTNSALLRDGAYAVGDGQRIPVDSAGKMLLVWHGDALHTYERIPIWQVIASIFPDRFPEHKVYFPPQYFRDKIIIVGVSARGTGDTHPTPFAEAEPGFIVHATAVDNLLHGEAIRLTPRWFEYLAILLFAAMGAGLLVRVRAITGASVAVAIIAGLYVVVCYTALSGAHLWLPMVTPLFALVVSALGTGAVHFATTGRELRRTRGTLDRYISPALVDYALQHLDSINFAGEKRELTIFFSDIRNFTTLTEGSDPMELIALLNEYLAAMVEVIFKYEGIVDKFIGDGILAYWGAFTPGKNHALLAAQAGLEMIERLEQLNNKWEAEGRKKLAIGIGMNSGTVVFGNIGSGKKIEFTVIGDAVNLASRLEGLNKEFKTSIIISDAMRQKIEQYAVVRSLGEVKVKGKTVGTQIFELRALDMTGKTAGSIEHAVEQPTTSEAVH